MLSDKAEGLAGSAFFCCLRFMAFSLYFLFGLHWDASRFLPAFSSGLQLGGEVPSLDSGVAWLTWDLQLADRLDSFAESW